MAKKALGKGLDALFQPYDSVTYPKKDSDYIQKIKISDIDPNPYQPRKNFSSETIEELASSIRQHGVVQPVLVKPEGNRFLLVAGERRWRAARMAGLEVIPAIVRNFSRREILEIMLIENLQREDLNPIEEAQGIKTLIDEYHLTHEEIAERIGKSRSAISNSLRLLKLPREVQQYLIDGKLSAGHARVLVSLDDDLKIEIAKKIIEKGLSVRQTEKLVKDLNKKKGNKSSKKDKPAYIVKLQSDLEECLGTRVVITPGKKKGVIEIEYYSDEDLERIMEKLLD